MVGVRNYLPRCRYRRRRHPSVRYCRSHILGTTIGKSAFGLRVTRLDGSRPGAGQCQVRAITFWAPVGAVSVVMLYLLATGAAWVPVVFLLIVASVVAARVFLQGKFFHDWVARTCVVEQFEHVAHPKRGISRATKLAGAAVMATTAMAVVALVWAWIRAHPDDLSAHEQQAYIQDNRASWIRCPSFRVPRGSTYVPIHTARTGQS